MAGRKFGSSDHEDLTWAMNAHVPALVAEAFAGSRIVAYSTGCVYPYVSVLQRRRDRGDARHAAAGDLRQFLRRTRRHVPVFLAHARHARPHHPPQLCDRYALRRAARCRHARVRRRHHQSRNRPRRTSSGRATPTAWCCARSATARRPRSPLNVSGPETISVRWLAETFGQRFGKAPMFAGSRGAGGLAGQHHGGDETVRLSGVPLARLIDWTADWVARGSAEPRQGYALRHARWPVLIPRSTLRSPLRPRGFRRRRRAGARGRLESNRRRLADLSRSRQGLCRPHQRGPRDRDRRDAAVRAASAGSAWCWSRRNFAAAAWRAG